MKYKRPKPRKMRAIRIEDSLWAAIQRAAYEQGRNVSEFIRRTMESAIAGQVREIERIIKGGKA